MNLQSKKRRRFIKASLAIPLLSNLPWTIPGANAVSGDSFFVPENIQQELFMIYGGYANSIVTTDRLKLNVPDIAENGAVVGVNVTGDKNMVSSMAIFVAQSPKPLASKCTLHEGTDLAVGLRLKIGKTSDVYVIAQTNNGLVGVMRTVKVTIGCGGG